VRKCGESTLYPAKHVFTTLWAKVCIPTKRATATGSVSGQSDSSGTRSRCDQCPDKTNDPNWNEQKQAQAERKNADKQPNQRQHAHDHTAPNTDIQHPNRAHRMTNKRAKPLDFCILISATELWSAESPSMWKSPRRSNIPLHCRLMNAPRKRYLGFGNSPAQRGLQRVASGPST